MVDIPVIIASSSGTKNGKTTFAINLAVALLYSQYKVRLFSPQNELVECFIKQRSKLNKQHNLDLPMPEIIYDVSALFDKTTENQVIIADIPSEKNSEYSNIFALSHTLITIVGNKKDVMWDFSNPYLNLIWETKKVLAAKGIKYLNWIVVENKISDNNDNIENIIHEQGKKFGFRTSPKLSYRPVFQNVTKGYTPMDLQNINSSDMNDIYARREILNLTDFMWQKK